MDSKDIIQISTIEEFADRYKFTGVTHPLFLITRLAGQG